MKTETIAAIATSLSESGISIIRISGEDAAFIADKIISTKSVIKVSEFKSHTIHYAHVMDGENVVDEVMVSYMKGPYSFTAENTVEINCHGGVLITKKVLQLVLRSGARLAYPGEFTKRAFLNGRIDLTQAESVIDVINSKNSFALKSSLSQLKGSVLTDVKKIRGNILHEIAFIETALDDPEHISLDGYNEQLLDVVNHERKEIKRLLDSSDNGRILKEGINTVILGKPNAGKSSLLNVLVGEERAIVTDIAGTTRDVLEEQINLHGISLNIMDTAGIRNTEDVVEKIGVTKAKEYANKADFIIYVIDSSTALDESDFEIMEILKDKKAVVLLNKSDLDVVTSKEEVEKHLDKSIIAISAKENTGITELEEKIKEMFFHGEVSFNDEVYITNIRQKNSLQDALDSLNLVVQSIEDDMPEDFYSIDLMSAYESLGKMIGESVEDDLVNEIFSKFCMGK